VKPNQSWISLLGFCLVTVFGAALAFAVIVAGASVALVSHQLPDDRPAQKEAPGPSQAMGQVTFSGLVTDAYCGARHLRHSSLTPEQCAAACIRNGATYLLVDGDHRYTLSGNKESLNRLLGMRADVTGTREGDTIVVSSAGPTL
jgi:hypothetical protein